MERKWCVRRKDFNDNDVIKELHMASMDNSIDKKRMSRSCNALHKLGLKNEIQTDKITRSIQNTRRRWQNWRDSIKKTDVTSSSAESKKYSKKSCDTKNIVKYKETDMEMGAKERSKKFQINWAQKNETEEEKPTCSQAWEEKETRDCDVEVSDSVSGGHFGGIISKFLKWRVDRKNSVVNLQDHNENPTNYFFRGSKNTSTKKSHEINFTNLELVFSEILKSRTNTFD